VNEKIKIGRIFSKYQQSLSHLSKNLFSLFQAMPCVHCVFERCHPPLYDPPSEGSHIGGGSYQGGIKILNSNRSNMCARADINMRGFKQSRKCLHMTFMLASVPLPRPLSLPDNVRLQPVLPFICSKCSFRVFIFPQSNEGMNE